MHVQLVAVKVKTPYDAADQTYPYDREWVAKCRADFHALRKCRDAHQAQARAQGQHSTETKNTQSGDIMHVFGAIVSPEEREMDFVDYSRHPSDVVRCALNSWAEFLGWQSQKYEC